MNRQKRVISTEVPLYIYDILKKKSDKNDVTISQILRAGLKQLFPGEF